MRSGSGDCAIDRTPEIRSRKRVTGSVTFAVVVLLLALVASGRLHGWAAAWHFWRGRVAELPPVAMDRFSRALEVAPRWRPARLELEAAARRVAEAEGEAAARRAPSVPLARLAFAIGLAKAGEEEAAVNLSTSVPDIPVTGLPDWALEALAWFRFVGGECERFAALQKEREHRFGPRVRPRADCTNA